MGKHEQCGGHQGGQQWAPGTRNCRGMLSKVCRHPVQEKAEEQWASRITLPNTPLHQEGQLLLTSNTHLRLGHP